MKPQPSPPERTVTPVEQPASGTAWVLTDTRAGNRRQALALADALVPDGYRQWQLSPRRPWRWCAPRQIPGSRQAFGSYFAQALQAPPALAIGCGRQAALATRLAGAHGARTVQILDPRIDPAHWDLVIAPEHDALHGANVITLLGSLHPVDDAWLTRARAAWPGLGALPGPRTALLLGGDSRHARFDLATFEALATQIDRALAETGGSVLATASRRTPADVRQALRARAWPGVRWVDAGDGPNPYAGLLAWADRIVCTADSVNMLSEACATHVPVHVPDPTGMPGAPGRFVQALLARGRIRPLQPALPAFTVTALREPARVAALVRQRLALD